MLRIQFISSQMGVMVIRKGDPANINALTKTLKRSSINDGVIREIILDLEAIKKGRTFLKRAFEQTGGPDAKVTANVYRYDFNRRKYVAYATGRVNFSKYELTEDKLTIDIEQVGFQRDVENAISTVVDLTVSKSINGIDITPNPLINFNTHGKSIEETFESKPDTIADTVDNSLSTTIFNGGGVQQTDMVAIGEINNAEDIIRETNNDIFHTGWVYTQGATLNNGYAAGTLADYESALETYKDIRGSEKMLIKNPGIGGIDVTLELKFNIHVDNTGGDVDICGSGALGRIEIMAWYELRDKNNVIKDLQRIGVWGMAGCGDNDRDGVLELKQFNLVNQTYSVGDKIYVYHTLRIYGDYDRPGILAPDGQLNYTITISNTINTKIKIVIATITADTSVKGSLMFESVRQLVRYATGQNDCLKSNLLGRTDLGYGEDGSGSLIVNTNGNQLRGKEAKPVTNSIQGLIDINNSLHAVGIGYETDNNGVQRLVLEKKNYFYNKNLRAISLGKVYNVRRRLDISRLYNLIQYGYGSKIDLEQINASDAFNTIRKAITPLRNSKSTNDFANQIKADSYQIEYERRLIGLTADGKHDDDNFIISCIRDGLNFKSKKNEGYSSITGIIDPSTIYNMDISPARNLLNWLPYIASVAIWASDKTIKGITGEGNLNVTSTKVGGPVVGENFNVPLDDVEPVWSPFLIDFGMKKLTCEQFDEIQDKANGFIEFQDRFGKTMQGFIDNGVTHNPTTLAATFELLEVFRPKK